MCHILVYSRVEPAEVARYQTVIIIFQVLVERAAWYHRELSVVTTRHIPSAVENALKNVPESSNTVHQAGSWIRTQPEWQ